jgi:hypothetical protein
MPHEQAPEIAVLLAMLDRAYDVKSWHGPNLRGSIRGLTARVAAWRPDPDRHSIAEQVLHAAYWKYAVRRRLLGAKRGSFALEGSNWFQVSDSLEDETWRAYTAMLEVEHSHLRVAVASLPSATLDHPAPGGKGEYSCRDLVLGIAAHDVYHAGQIQLLKRLAERD